MNEDVKAQFVEQGLTEAEAEFIMQSCGDMELSPEDTYLHLYADRDDFFESQLDLVADFGVNVDVEPLSTMLSLVDPGRFYEAASNLGENWELVELPTGRIAEIIFN